MYALDTNVVSELMRPDAAFPAITFKNQYGHPGRRRSHIRCAAN